MNRFCGLILKSGKIGDQNGISPVLSHKVSHLKGKLTFWSEVKTAADFLFQGHIFSETFIWEREAIRSKLLHSPLQFSGSWVFASLDESKGILTLCRDQIGGRSIYFVDDPDYFAFSTDIKSLFELTPLKPSLNQAVVFDYFVQSEFDNLNEKLFEGVRELAPGSHLYFDLKTDSFRLEKYVEPDYNSDYTPFNDRVSVQYSTELRSILDELFEVQMKEPAIGSSFLSGGLDSSLIALYAAKYKRSDWQFFTAGFTEKNIDESQEAKEMLEFLNMNGGHQVYPESADFMHDFRDMLNCIELPTFSAGTYIQYSLMKKLKELGINRILDGTGADALFAGHHYHYAFFWRELLATGSFSRYRNESKAAKIVSRPLLYLMKNELKYNSLSALPLNVQFGQRMRYFPELKFINRDIRETFKARILSVNKPKFKTLNALLFHEYYGGGVRKLQRYVHKCADRFDVSVHFPFSESTPLMEYVFSVPGSYKIQEGKLKYLVREAFKKELPERLYKGTPKKGLLSPNNQWVRDHKDQFKSLLLDGNSDVFNIDLMEKEYDRFFYPETDQENYRIFKFISFALWRETFKI